MFTVYSGSGAKDYSIGEACLPSDRWASFRRAASKLLRAQGYDDVADLFEALPFELRQGENFFRDDFVVLYAELPIEGYTEVVNKYSDMDERHVFQAIAHVLKEICPFHVRFIAFDAALGEGISHIQEAVLRITNRTVEEALADARQLIASRGSTSGVDRAHTAFHGYLRVLCEDASIDISEDANITTLYRALRDRHPRMAAEGARSEDITQTLRALSSIITVLNPLRNRASLAHPNADLLERAEADLVLNCIHTLLHYLDRKLM